MNRQYLLVCFIFISLNGIALEEEKKFGIEFHGYVKTDFIYDSRQTVCFREGHFYLFPQNELRDYKGNDINARPVFNILAIQTRLTGNISGPEAFGAKTSGLIEGSFFGNVNSNLNVFRLRHAMVKLAWPHAELMIGQYWHPMFITSAFPETVSFNTGAPFQPFSRNPQIRFTKKWNKFSISGTVLEQIDFLSSGPLPENTSSKYMKNACIPEFNFSAEFKSDKIQVGGGYNIKNLMPRTYVETLDSLGENPDNIRMKTGERLVAQSFFAYAKLSSQKITYKLYGVLGQEMSSMTGIGGYAEHEYIFETFPDEIPDGYPNRLLTSITYTPISTFSAWTEILTNGKTWQIGLYAGFTKNMGAPDSISGKFYGRGLDAAAYVNYIYRISPRLVYTIGKFRIAPEIEYTVAAFATKDDLDHLYIDSKGKVIRSKEIPNYRFLIGVYYLF